MRKSVLKRYFFVSYIYPLTSTVLAGKLHNACLNMVLWAQFITDFNEIEPSQISYRDYHVKLTEYDTSAMKTFILWYSCHSLLFETSLNSLAVIQRWLGFLSIDWVLCWLCWLWMACESDQQRQDTHQAPSVNIFRMYRNVNEIELEMSTRQRTLRSRMAVIRCQCNKLTAEVSWRFVVVASVKRGGQRVRFRSFSTAMSGRGSCRCTIEIY